MRSMTGFGRGTVTTDDVSITVDLKTVNNRFLDIALKVSGELQPVETLIKRTISSRLARGRVDVSIQYERKEEVEYDLNRPVINGYINAFKKMQDEFSLAGEPDINVIARLPNVLRPSKNELGDEFIKALETAIGLAIDDLEKMRSAEGLALKNEMLSRIDNIAALLPDIEAASDSITDEYRAKLEKRITEMLAKSDVQIEIDQGRFAQEAAYLADKGDISEEITRLKTHLDHFRNISDETNEVGKRLDFLTQELNREANTITSKTANLKVKENALQIKSEIEKIREQVQNVE